MKRQRKEVIDFIKHLNSIEGLEFDMDYIKCNGNFWINILFDIDGQCYVNYLPVKLISKEVEYYDTNFWGGKIKRFKYVSFLDFDKEEMNYIFEKVKLEVRRRENQKVKDRKSLLSKLNLTEGELNELKNLLK